MRQLLYKPLNFKDISIIRLKISLTLEDPLQYFKKIKHSLYCIAVLGLILCPKTAGAVVVDQIRYGHVGTNVRMVLDIDAQSPFRVFTLTSPHRIILDLPDLQWSKKIRNNVAEYGITNIRRGLLKDNIARIVFDMDGATSVDNAYIVLGDQNKPTRLIIDYKPSKFNAADTEIFGNLNQHAQTFGAHTQNPNVIKASEKIPTPSFKPKTPDYAQNSENNYKPLIIIDPGHGGQDPGAISPNNLKEKNVVLGIAKELKKELEATGRYRVKMTRENDVFIRLRDRVKFAREHEGDLFISIHADSVHKKETSGASVYTISKKASDEQTAKLAEKENQADLIGGVELDTEDDQVAYILGDFMITDTMNQSKFFANTLVERMKKKSVRVLQNPHRFAGFAVLKAPDIPSVLIEAGFMSNNSESKELDSQSYRKKIASAILSGIDTYFEKTHFNRQP